MLGFAWLLHRQAQEALKNGRLEDAQRILAQPNARDQKGHAELAAKLAQAFVQRGERRLKEDDTEAAWRDLLEAEQLHTDDKSARQLRVALSRLGMAETRALLHAGELTRAEETIAKLQSRGLRLPEFKVLDESVKDWQRARDKAGQGEFATATEIVDKVRRRLYTSYRALEEFRSDLEVRQQKFAAQRNRLLEAADAGRWREVVEIAEQVLAVAPEHAEARKLRSRAWTALEPETLPVALPASKASEDDVVCDGLPGRFLLWIDGVGGYLVCLNSRITFGHAGGESHVDVPLVADVSRLHASLSRDAEGYVLEAVKPIQVNGQTLTRATLRPGDRVTVGASCQFQFHQPVPVSTTARLDLVSGHRLSLTVDGILLMADTLVLGSGPQVHINVPDLKKKDIVLFRHKDGVGIRHDGNLLVDGRKSPPRGVLGPNATVTGPEVSFTIEPVGLHLGTV
jgi:tetratricopeptide (TPR) repeat protein